MYNRLVVERGGEYKLILSDGSEVWVNSATVLEYPVVFSGNRRIVKLNGEAYFKVQADSLRPFIVVVAGGMEVCALGTVFNVNAYAERFVESVLVKGKISVGKEDRRVTLRPAQLAVYDRETGQTDVKDVDIRKYVDWKSGEFIFSDDCLEEIMKKIFHEEFSKIRFLEKKLRLITGIGITLPVVKVNIFDDKGDLYSCMTGSIPKFSNVEVRDYNDDLKKKLSDNIQLYITDDAIKELEEKNERFKKALNFYVSSFDSTAIRNRFILLFSSLEALFNISKEDITKELTEYSSKILF